MKIFIQLLLSYFLFNFASYAANVPVDSIISKCHVTSTASKLEKMPKKFEPNNNLYQITGQFNHAQGNKMVILMRVMDKNCIPITGATIKLWQKNSLGYYQDNIVNSNHKLDSKKFDKYFAGSGMATTDNFGRATFTSVIPDDKNPAVNIIIEVKNHKNYEYVAYLKNNRLNKVTATKYQELFMNNNNNLDNEIKHVLSENNLYMQDFTLDIKQAYKQY